MTFANRRAGTLLIAILAAAIALCPGWGPGSLTGRGSEGFVAPGSVTDGVDARSESGAGIDLADIPSFRGSPCTEINGNSPEISESDLGGREESYAPLDGIGRDGTAMAKVGSGTMPEGERGSIGMVRPSGWHTVRYDDLIDGRYLYNRCHLIGYQLTGENANERNLITGTRYMNVQGMLPFEDEVADYVRETGNHVLYRSTPVFAGDELVARGVHLEARSVEDDGAGVSFNVFCYNVQPGIEIDYATGESRRAPRAGKPTAPEEYVLNTRTGTFHLPGCGSVRDMSERNKRVVSTPRDELVDEGYEPCGRCNP